MCPDDPIDPNEQSDKTVIVSLKTKEHATSALEPFLVQTSGRQTGQHIALKKTTMKLGRDATCEIVLDDPHISRVHGEITWVNDKLILKDLGSTNGIVVNGTKIKEHTLEEGDKILVGTRLYFQFRYLDANEQSSQQSLFNAANKDTLTGLYSRRYFQDIIAKEFSFSKRNQQPLSLMMIDIDFFKKINDTYGHLGGDAVLKKVGGLFQSGLRMENISARYGGEEFVIILRNVHSDLALQIAERLRKTIEAEKFEFQDQEIPVTVSIGIATLDHDNYNTVEDLIQAADEYLYEAKEGGRNQVALRKAA